MLNIRSMADKQYGNVLNNQKQIKMKKIYEENKIKKVGENCVCLSCGTNFVKTNYQQAFYKNWDYL